MNNPQTKEVAATLRRRLQTCEKRIIETANWDVNYFYDGSLPPEQCGHLIELLMERKRLLNRMYIYTENENKRVEHLDYMLANATQQMYAELNSLHDKRRAMPKMEPYNGDTWFEAELSYNYNANDSVIKMPEDTYYGSQFDKMLELLSAEEERLGYRKECSWAFRQLSEKLQHDDDKEERDFCQSLHDLMNHHLYSVPDVLRMNRFTIKLDMRQIRTLTA